ncbi:hypothetical protein WDH52_06470 [Streptomyces sp. TRM70308]|uniref:hypothetical protein n=1 Tax=Streptomyces sp. TRM70308 TaxID=3131932 RepID=UPI003D035283
MSDDVVIPRELVVAQRCVHEALSAVGAWTEATPGTLEDLWARVSEAAEATHALCQPLIARHSFWAVTQALGPRCTRTPAPRSGRVPCRGATSTGGQSASGRLHACVLYRPARRAVTVGVRLYAGGHGYAGAGHRRAGQAPLADRG